MDNIYNLMNGVNPATFFILPMLGKHPDDYPRFRNCFLHDDQIYVLTRVGRSNLNQGYGEEVMMNDPNFVKMIDGTEVDDTLDDTYGVYIFNIPDKWKAELENIKLTNKFSNEYTDEMIRVYPKLKDKFEMMKSK